MKKMKKKMKKSGKDVVMYGIIVILSGVGQLLMDIVRMASVESWKCLYVCFWEATSSFIPSALSLSLSVGNKAHT